MKGRTAKKAGGSMDSPKEGKQTFNEDLKKAPKDRTKSDNIGAAAKKRKAGGRTELKVGGAAPAANAGRSARKGGGSCVSSPMSSAAKGTPATGRRKDRNDEN